MLNNTLDAAVTAIGCFRVYEIELEFLKVAGLIINIVNVI